MPTPARTVLVLLAALLLAACGGAPAAASNDFLDLLAHVPDTPEIRESGVLYANQAALIASRQGAASDIAAITTGEQFNALADADDPAAALWLAAMQGLYAAPQFYSFFPALVDDMPETTGFELFAIQRSIYAGSPPADLTILALDFDRDATAAALTAQGYGATDTGNRTYLCVPDQCDDQALVDPSRVNPGYPFGGRLGRRDAILLADGLLLASPSNPVLRQASDTFARGPSLADDPDFSAVAQAVASQGTLLQAATFAPIDRAALVEGLLGAGFSPERAEQLREQLGLDKPISEQLDDVVPPYTLGAFADLIDGDQQLVLIALVYTSQTDAETAADRFVGLMNDYISLQFNRPLADLLADRDATIGEPRVFSAGASRYVALVPISAPRPLDQPDDDTGQYISSSMLFRLFYTAYLQRDTLYLAPVLIP